MPDKAIVDLYIRVWLKGHIVHTGKVYWNSIDTRRWSVTIAQWYCYQLMILRSRVRFQLPLAARERNKQGKIDSWGL
jgi:hypothetical protein